MKVASNLNPTSLRGIQHYSQKTEQATKMINSYSEFKNECNCLGGEEADFEEE